MNRKSDFEVIKWIGHTVYIRDTNRGIMSVTNDAENVVAFLRTIYGDCKIVYCDSVGEWGELRHDKGVFTGFGPADGPKEALS